MSKLRSILTFLFLASLAASLVPEDIARIRAARHPLLRPLTETQGTFEKVALDVVQSIYEPFGIEIPQAWQNTDHLLAMGLAHNMLQELLEDLPENSEELVMGNILEGLDPAHFQTLKAQDQNGALFTDLRKRLGVIGTTIVTALKSDIALQILHHDFEAENGKAVELRINKQLLRRTLAAVRDQLTDIHLTTQADISEYVADFHQAMKEKMDDFSKVFLKQVSESVSLLSDAGQFLAAEMTALAAGAASQTESESLETVHKIKDLAKVYRKLTHNNVAVNQFLAFCAKEYLSLGRDNQLFAGRLLAFFSQAVLVIYDERNYQAALDLVNVFNNDRLLIPSFSPAQMHIFEAVLDNPTVADIGLMKVCWAALVLSERPKEVSFATFQRLLMHLSEFQGQRKNALHRFNHAALFLSSSMVPAEDRTVNLEQLFRVVIEAEVQPTDEKMDQANRVNTALDVAYALHKTLRPLEYFLGKVLNAIISSSLQFDGPTNDQILTLSFMTSAESDNAKDAPLLDYLAQNTQLQGLLRKVVQETTKQVPEFHQPESVADLVHHVWNHRFSLNDFDYGSLQTSSRVRFDTLDLPAVEPVDVKVTHGDFSNSGDSEFIPLSSPFLSPEKSEVDEQAKKGLNLLPNDLSEDPILSGDIRVISDDA